MIRYEHAAARDRQAVIKEDLGASTDGSRIRANAPPLKADARGGIGAARAIPADGTAALSEGGRIHLDDGTMHGNATGVRRDGRRDA